MDNNLSEQQKEYLEEEMVRASAFEQMLTTQGWVYVKAYIENRIQTFANTSIKEGFKTMEEYAYERGEVNGLRKLLSRIDESIKTAYEQKKKDEVSK